MVLSMQYSGYNKKFGYEVLDSALKAMYRVRQVEEEKGVNLKQVTNQLSLCQQHQAQSCRKSTDRRLKEKGSKLRW